MTSPDLTGVERLSQLASGNDHLVSEPGLMLALYQGNATPDQATQINQFVGGLKAEAKVRTAASAGTQIPLSQDEQTSLDAMGVDYSHVLMSRETAVQKLKTQMAKTGYEPVLDSAGNPIVNAKGEVKSQPINAAQTSALPGSPMAKAQAAMNQVFKGFGTNWADRVGKDVSGFVDQGVNGAKLPGTSGGTVSDWSNIAMGGYNLLSSAARPSTAAESVRQNYQQAELAQRMGYNPDNPISMLAFQSKGYAFNDTSSASAAWDTAHPSGLFGMDGSEAALQAEQFLLDPAGYEKKFLNDPKLPDAAKGAKMAQLNSPEWRDMVKRVGYYKASVGADLARHAGVAYDDPSFKQIQVGGDIVAMFMADPLNFGLGIYQGAQKASTAIANFTDKEALTRILTADAKDATPAQWRVQGHLKNLVKLVDKSREAAGDETQLAKIQAQANANPFGGLMDHFTKNNIDTYDKAVEQVTSQAALIRLVGGRAPVEFGTIPGATSTLFASKLKGALGSLQTERTLIRADRQASKLIGAAEADPALGQQLVSSGILRRGGTGFVASDPLVPGKALISPALLDKLLPREGDVSYELTDAGRGAIRRSELDFGAMGAANPDRAVKALQQAQSDSKLTSLVGNTKLLYHGITGTAQRLGQVVKQTNSMLPMDLKVNVTSAADGDKIYRLAKTYMTVGDANLLKARWTFGDATTRKAVVQGLREQIYHASGLSRTAAGRQYLDDHALMHEQYSTVDVDYLDHNGRPGALFPSEVETNFTLPSYSAVHQAAAKIGLYEATMGRALNSVVMDRMLMPLWKMQTLLTPVTGVRAIVETLLGTGFDRDFGLLNTLGAKAIQRDAGTLDVKGLKRNRMLEVLSNTRGLSDVGQFYRNVLKARMDPKLAEAIAKMPDERITQRLLEQAYQHSMNQLDPGGMREAQAISQAGLDAKRVSWDAAAIPVKHRLKGYEVTDEVDGHAGAELYAFTLGSKVNENPELTRAILDRIEHPEDFDIGHVVAAMDADRLSRQMLWGKVYHRDGVQVEAVTPQEVAIGKEQWANHMVADMRQMLTGRNGVYQKHLAQYLKDEGMAPNGDWLSKEIKGLDRPGAMLRPVYQAVAPDLSKVGTFREGLNNVANALLDAEGRGYRYLVERPIQRMSVSPVYALQFGKARMGLDGMVNDMVKAGWDQTSAEHIAGELADQQAWNRVSTLVDDPAQKVQMDITGRGFFAFSRATNTALRRWAGIMWRNPQQARRAMLTWEAAQHAGIMYDDPTTGQQMFLIPATGVAQQFLLDAMGKVPWLKNEIHFPVSDFEGKVTSIIPGSSNPLQYGTSPFVSIGGRSLATLFPDGRIMFDQLDAKFNGQAGQGKGVLDVLTPRLFRQFTDAELDDSRNSVLNSATIGALYTLGVAGKLPKDGASNAEIQVFMDRLKTTMRSVLGLRMLFGSISPATIAVPGDTTKPDFSYMQRGIKSMRDEFSTLINDCGGDYARALSIWTYMHPDDSIFSESSTQSMSKDAVLPASRDAYYWTAQHGDFINKYKSVAAYFLPEPAPGSKTQPFDMAAYRAQLEQGFRQRKTPTEFLNTYRINAASGPYYAAEDDFNSQYAAAKQAGNSALMSQLHNEWSTWSTAWKQAHPTFAYHLSSMSSQTGVANAQLDDLRFMVKNNDVPGTPEQKQAVGLMVQTYESFREFMSHTQGNSNVAKGQRANAAAQLQQFFTQMIAAHPELKDLYNGVFRAANDRNLDYLGAGG